MDLFFFFRSLVFSTRAARRNFSFHSDRKSKGSFLQENANGLKGEI